MNPMGMEGRTLFSSRILSSCNGAPFRTRGFGLCKGRGGLLFSRSRLLKCNCSSSSDGGEDWVLSPSASPYQILGVDPTSCSAAQLKAAFRARVKEFHPDVCKDAKNADLLMRRVIEAYQMLSSKQQGMEAERPCEDPFENPECEAYDIFVNEVQCVGKGCPYSCVKRAPHAFSFTEDGTARTTSQAHGDDYLVQLAVGQCPRRCIFYVTPSQRAVLEDLLESVLRAPYDLADAALLDSLLSKAKFENNRYQKPRRQPKASTEYVDLS